MENTLASAVNDAPEVLEEEKFLVIKKDAFKRSGVILRLSSIIVSFLALILAVALPMVTIDYASYSSTTTFSADRAARFPSELINGWNNLFGGSHFGYYLKSKYGVEVLYTSMAKFNWILFLILVCSILFAILAFFVTFSKKMEKLSKLVILGYIICGLGCLCSPIWFMAINNFGNTQGVSTADLTHYVMYDSLYVHAAYGAIVSCLVFVLAGVLFGIGTGREMAGGDDRNNEE